MNVKSTVLLPLLLILTISIDAQPQWNKIANGIWKTNIGPKQNITLHLYRFCSLSTGRHSSFSGHAIGERLLF